MFLGVPQRVLPLRLAVLDPAGGGPSPPASAPLPVLPELPELPARGGMAGVQQCLHQLHRCLQPGDAASAALHGYSLLRSLGETCLTSLAGGAQGAPSGPDRTGRGGWRQGLAAGAGEAWGGCSVRGLCARPGAAVASLVPLKQPLRGLGRAG